MVVFFHVHMVLSIAIFPLTIPELLYCSMAFKLVLYIYIYYMSFESASSSRTITSKFRIDAALHDVGHDVGHYSQWGTITFKQCHV